MAYNLKTFKVEETVNHRFKEECARYNLKQGDVLELLMVRWVKMKNGSRKRKVDLYGKE